ncbi:MAG: hypothetical protein K1X87_04255 [Dehalococcoidia bacterium]|nr:hypothetical protein [Dehalococcoidia bacterium]
MALNAEWHAAHPMPPRTTFEERARWHLEHREACGCRPIPAKLAAQMRERGLLSE